MKIDKDSPINSEVNSKRSGFFHDRPKVGLNSNNIATMRAIILLADTNEESEANEFNPQPSL